MQFNHLSPHLPQGDNVLTYLDWSRTEENKMHFSKLMKFFTFAIWTTTLLEHYNSVKF